MKTSCSLETKSSTTHSRVEMLFIGKDVLLIIVEGRYTWPRLSALSNYRVLEALRKLL